MNPARRLARPVAASLAATMMLASVPVVPANAAMVSTQEAVAPSAMSERAQLQAFVKRADVRQQMQRLGVDPNEAEQRIAALSDDEVRRISGKLGDMPAGQGIVEAVLIGAGIIFVVLILTDLLGVTDVFPFIESQR